jgi:glycosyltransferase involved in cell wall biosynthesis
VKIAMVGQRGIPATFGGVEHAVEELGAELVARGHDVVVYCRRGYGGNRSGTHRGMHLVHLPAPRTAGLEAFGHTGLATAHLLMHAPDIVHFHAIGPGLFTPVPRYLRRIPVVQTIHGMDNHRAKWGRGARRVLDAGVWMSHKVPDATIVVSRDLETMYRTRWQHATTEIPNGVRAFAAPDGRDELDALGLAHRGYLLFVGRLVPEKAPDQLLRAFRALDTDVRLVVVGDSSHTDVYANAVRALAADDDRVVLPGFVYGDAKAQLLANARAFVLPSLLEGLPIVLLEALAAHLPIVASSIAPNMEVLGRDRDSVRLVEPGNEESLREALAWAVNPDGLPVRLAGATALARDALARYDWADIAARTEAVYEAALRRRHRSPPT